MGSGVGTTAEARLRALLDALPDLMLRLRGDGTYLDVAGDTSRLAHTPDVLYGANAWDILPAEVAEELMGAIERALAEERLQHAVYELRTVDGALRDFEARVVPSAEDEVVIVVRDVTEQKQTLEQLRESRLRIVQAGDAERHRLERNLHDGAQQRLVAVSHHLQLVGRTLDDDPALARALLQTGQDELAAALAEIRELVRGLHPSILTERGLRPALDSLAKRSPLPVEVSAPDERVAADAEAAAFYVVAEALTNAAKHAGASSAAVAVTVAGPRLVAEVADNGRGGADPLGGGLRGLADRVEALGGTFAVVSPPGAGTRVRAEIPL